MKITLEADLPNENIAEPVVLEQVATAGIVAVHAGIVGTINQPVIHMHGNLWDVHRLFGEAQARTLVFTLQSLGVVPHIKPPKPTAGIENPVEPPDASVN